MSEASEIYILKIHLCVSQNKQQEIKLVETQLEPFLSFTSSPTSPVGIKSVRELQRQSEL